MSKDEIGRKPEGATDLTKLETLLSNSDLYIHIDGKTHDIAMHFITMNGRQEVYVQCRNVLEYRVIRIPMNNEAPYVIGEARCRLLSLRTVLDTHQMDFRPLSEDEIVWNIELIGAIDLSITCLFVDYQMEARQE
jgi:hypothetical protein